MTELIQASLALENIIYTALLVIVLLYWLSVILGGLDMGSIDIDLDIDADIDVDADLDAGGSADGWFAGALHFFNFGKLPTMVILSFTILFNWMINILMNHYVGGGHLSFALVLAIPNLFVSLVLTKIVTTPLIPVFAQLNAPEEKINFTGMLCKLMVSANTTKKGQAEVIYENRSILIYVKVDDAEKSQITKGEQAVILRPAEDASYYYIRKATERNL